MGACTSLVSRGVQLFLYPRCRLQDLGDLTLEALNLNREALNQFRAAGNLVTDARLVPDDFKLLVTEIRNRALLGGTVFVQAREHAF